MTHISAIAAKTAPVLTDEFELQETSDGNSKKTTLSNLTKGLGINAVTDKATPVTGDELLLADSAASSVAKKADIGSVVKAGQASITDLGTIASATSGRSSSTAATRESTATV